MAEQAERIYIREAARLLNRQMATLRKWEQLGVLPKHLLPHRGQRDWRYWTPDQIEGIKQWIEETDRRPGKGLPHYDPDAEKSEQSIKKMRRPRLATLQRLWREGKLPADLQPEITEEGPEWSRRQIDKIAEQMEDLDKAA